MSGQQYPPPARPRPAVDIESLAQGITAGQRLALARGLRLVDDRPDLAQELLRRLYGATGRAHVIGLTGNPGAGKSTLSDVLIRGFRARGESVAVLAIDPSSPFSGGALLGDRIRMNAHAEDDGVFIRSLATRGHLGGLTASTYHSILLLDAAGYQRVIVETVGVGQDEVDIARTAHTTLVVVVPGLGDDIQSIKAGLLEIADLFVLNKCDRPGADQTQHDLHIMLTMLPDQERTWEPEIFRTVAIRGDGVGELMAAVDNHRAFIREHPAGQRKLAEQRRQLFDSLLDTMILQRGRALIGSASLTEARGQAGELTTDIFALAEGIAAKLGAKLGA